MSPRRDCPAVATVDRYSRCSVSRAVPRASSLMPRMALRGVRISWLMLARNSAFARVAASASPIARRAKSNRFHAKALALIAESVRRTHGLTAYDVQLLAGLVLADGQLAEMATGKSNAMIAQTLYMSVRAVEKHISSIFQKLDLVYEGDVNRRVLAVLAYLDADDS